MLIAGMSLVGFGQVGVLETRVGQMAPPIQFRTGL